MSMEVLDLGVSEMHNFTISQSTCEDKAWYLKAVSQLKLWLRAKYAVRSPICRAATASVNRPLVCCVTELLYTDHWSVTDRLHTDHFAFVVRIGTQYYWVHMYIVQARRSLMVSNAVTSDSFVLGTFDSVSDCFYVYFYASANSCELQRYVAW